MKTNKMIKNTSRIVALTICFLFTQNVFSGVAVVVNPSSTLTSAKAGEIKKVFLGKSKKILGQTVKPIDNSEEDIRNKFLKKIIKKNPRAFKSYWTRLVFSGKSAPLKSGGNDADVKQWVNNNDDAIGFIDSKNVDDSVKAIFKID